MLRNKNQAGKLKHIVREISLTSVNKHNLRLIFAAMFLFVLLAEFGAHVMAHANAPHGHELVSVAGGGPDEPCAHVMPCCDNRHSDQPVPNSSHQVIPNDFLEITHFFPEVEVNVSPPIPFSQANALYRESSPPFHPPRLS